MTMDQSPEITEFVEDETDALPVEGEEGAVVESESENEIAGIEIPSAANDELIRVLEAMLFASAQPLSLSTMRERMPEGADVGGLLLQLQQTYESRGVTLVNIDGYWAFRTASDLGAALQLKKEVRRPLSRAAMETMAIVAYHQPVTRAEIENIRGVVTSGGTLDILMEEGWVKPGRRRETPGRPLTWVTTTDFLDQFGLQALTDLPGLDELKSSGLLDRRPAIDATTADMFDQIEEEDAAAESDEEDAMATEEELAALKAEAAEEDSDEDGIAEDESGEEESDDDVQSDEDEDSGDDESDDDSDEDESYDDDDSDDDSDEGDSDDEEDDE